MTPQLEAIYRDMDKIHGALIEIRKILLDDELDSIVPRIVNEMDNAFLFALRRLRLYLEAHYGSDD